LKFSIEKETLLSLLSEHSKVIPLRTTLPILSCALFLINKNSLTIKTTNLDQTIISNTKIKDEESGSIAIPMNKLLEIVSALPKEEIKIVTNEDFLVEINSKQGTYKITGRGPEEFPEKNKTETKKTISLPSKDFINIINKTAYATSKDDLKPALTGVYFNIEEKQITAVSTDGHKLVKYEKEILNPNKTEQALIIPAKFLNILKGSMKETGDLLIDVDTDHITTKQQNFTFISRIIKEKFPDFNSVIPADNKIKASIDATGFTSCVKRVAIFSNRNTKQTILNFNANGVVVSSEDLETATSGKEHFQCDFEGTEISTSYNAKYLCETIQHINSKKINIFLNTPLSAAVIVPEQQKQKEKLTTLLMPLRINI